MNKDELIGSIIDFTHDLNELCDRSTLVITVGQYGDKRIHITEASLFFELFSTYEFQSWNEEKYHGCVSTILDDVEFFAILTHEEFKKYIQSVVSSTNEK